MGHAVAVSAAVAATLLACRLSFPTIGRAEKHDGLVAAKLPMGRSAAMPRTPTRWGLHDDVAVGRLRRRSRKGHGVEARLVRPKGGSSEAEGMDYNIPGLEALRG